MSVIQSDVRPGAYYDSVILMQLQRSLAGLPGVLDAGVVMATEANRDLLVESDLLPDSAGQAGANDLLIVVRAESEAIATGALAQVNDLLARRRSTTASTFRPRSMESAAKQLPQAQWVLVSVPGKYAAGVARQALDLNRHVFLYSDNVSLEDEVSLKQAAREKGLLVMGPDCGTAIVNGVGLGFANHVRRGPIGLVGASGTGLQAISSHIHNLGGGVSHAIGTGGRDLKSAVGAITAHQALDLLDRDPETEVIVLVSKPPAPEVAARLLAAAREAGKPVVVNFIGQPPVARQSGNLHFAGSLYEAAVIAQQLAEQTTPQLDEALSPLAGWLRGLFSGGTLAYEATLGLQAMLTPLYSNAAIHPEQQLTDDTPDAAHTIIDLGDDQFTVGRLHPMMDNDLRLRRLQQAANDPAVGMILLDVVLGEGSHSDSASELAPAIAAAREKRAVEVVAIVVGTDDDPQNASAQATQLAEAGAIVFRNTAAAVAYVGHRLQSGAAESTPSVALESLQAPLAGINVGLESFADSLQGQGAGVVHVDWQPPAGGNARMMSLLAKLKGK